ncbi:MMPL family protein [Planctomycetes bacterium CA13]|uniref:MMPL family protein n=1 Tax=Novipirellula herctigrandis TaxID=2527986 RepID=A0A5C5YW29_9BACT|nr:MMPL family protein [Planctomycetes bacterium CA13]
MNNEIPPTNETPSRWPSMTVRLASFAFALVLFPIVIIGATRAWENSGTKVEDWLPSGFEETERLIQFFDRFGSDELLMIGWEGAKLGDPNLAQIRERLLAADPLDQQRRVFFRDVWTGDSVLQEMQDPPLGLTATQAKVRMAGWILGRDETTAVLALVSNDGMADRHRAIDFARRVATDVLDRPASEVHFAGPTIEAVAIDEASQSSLLRLNGYSFLVCIGLLIICLRRVWYAIVIFGIAIYNEQAAMALIHFSGSQMDSILLLTANLTLVLSVSAGIHMYGYYRHASQLSSDTPPARIAIRMAFKPTLLAAITTAIGFGSLAISQIVPVHKFGFYTAIAVPLAALLTLWYFAMYLPSSRRATNFGGNRNATIGIPTRQQSLQVRLLRRTLSKWPLVLFFFLSCIALGGVGLVRLRISTGLHDLFPDDAKLLGDYAWIEQRIGPLVPVEIVLECPSRDGRDVVDELALLGQLQARVRRTEPVGSLISAVNFSPPIPRKSKTSSLAALAYRAGLNAGLNQSLNRYQSLRLLRVDPDQRLWRLTARVEGSKPQEYHLIMDELRAATSETLATHGDPDITFTLSGGVPLAAKTQERLLSDLGTSYITAMVLIGATMAIFLRNLFAGALAMIPNILPAFVVFGWMGAMNWKVEIGGVMTASAVLGIAVDDSLHLIMSFREWYKSGLSRQHSVLAALATCSTAMVQTTLVCGLGMLVFSLSPFIPIQRFAWLMFSLLFVALLADLVLLPAILYSPLGRFFLSGSGPDVAEPAKNS